MQIDLDGMTARDQYRAIADAYRDAFPDNAVVERLTGNLLALNPRDADYREDSELILGDLEFEAYEEGYGAGITFEGGYTIEG